MGGAGVVTTEPLYLLRERRSWVFGLRSSKAQDLRPKTKNMQRSDNQKLTEIGRISIYGAKFHRLPPDVRRRVTDRIGEKITADTVKAAIKAEKK